MQCEICGANISGRSHRILVDRAELEVCEKCKTFGKEVERRAPAASIRKGAPTPQPSGAPVAARRPRRDLFDQMKDEIVDDYPEIVKNAREARHMTQEELAVKIQEKVNVIKKVERAEMVPEDALIKKLERALNIKLMHGVEETEPGSRRMDNRALTLGDLIKVKKGK